MRTNHSTMIGLAVLAVAFLGAGDALSLSPVALWTMDRLDGDQAVGNLKVVDHGPTAPAFPSRPPSHNPAIVFDGEGAFLRIADREDLRFDHGDSITIEAWIRSAKLANGQHAYIIGKGRTDAKKDNQNWALRLTGATGGHAKISFLFRSRANGGEKELYHRWTSSQSLPPKAWYHTAVRYTFGKPESMRGFIDGRPVKGKWDMGGPTKRPPVVDDDEIWIGSARGGDPGNSFQGSLDEVAVYRGLLSDEAIEERGRYIQSMPPPPWTEIPRDKVLGEIFATEGDPQRWPRLDPSPPESLTLDNLAFLEIPHIYTGGGVCQDRSLPLLLRMAAPIELPPGNYEILFRAPGLARLHIDSEEIAQIDAFTLPRNGHNDLRPQPRDDAERRRFPRLPIGCRETRIDFQSTGSRHQVIAESLLGKPGLRFTMNPFLVAFRARGQANAPWKLLGPAPIPFTPEELEIYRAAQEAAMESLNNRRRAEAQAIVAPHWNRRHEEARQFIQGLPPIRIPGDATQGNPVDRFILAKIESTAPPLPDTEQTPPLTQTAFALLQERCLRCHGEKSKGGLRLDIRNSALSGGDSGEAAITPGDPGKSLILQRIQSTDPDERMPPKGHALTQREIESLIEWIDQGAAWPANHGPVTIPPMANRLPLLRRVYLDVLGIPPSAETAKAYAARPDAHEWVNLIDQLLDHPRHADHWVSYWQDVLAENPRLVKGKLNNTGPFRWWIHDSLKDNKPFDQFVTELVTFSGSKHAGGAGGFGIATQNDVPMAAKAHVIGTAFLGTEMKCARCHDAPYHSATQRDLFSIAAMLENKPITLPPSSTVPASFLEDRSGHHRPPRIEVTLKPGSVIDDAWPFESHTAKTGSGANRGATARDRLAREITHPANRRFAQVIVNRIWRRYFGQGLVDPVHDWEGQTPSHPQLLDYLAREFVRSGYNLKTIHRLILTSEAYQRRARSLPAGNADSRFFEAPLRRRLSAEQLVDSLFTATSVPFYSEELSFDPEGAHPPDVMQNLGTPRRAWQFNAVSSERDRPSLTLPRASSIIAVMEAFGWRANRSEPISDREVTDNVLQPAMLGNGLFGLWITRLSDYSGLTQLALEAASPGQLIDDLYLRLLTRQPTREERQAFVALLTPGFEERLTKTGTRSATTKRVYVPEVREVTWASHLKVAANHYAAATEERVSQGPPPTGALQSDWRQRLEDVIWALINAPEMQFTP